MKKTLSFYVVVREDGEAIAVTREALAQKEVTVMEEVVTVEKISADSEETQEVRRMVPVKTKLDTDEKIEAYFAGKGYWENVHLEWPFRGRHNRDIRALMRNWDPNTKSYQIEQEMWNAATVEVVVAEWSLNLPKAGEPEHIAQMRKQWDPTIVGLDNMPAELSAQISTEVWLACYEARNLEDFTPASTAR